jgi:hypothetical protein
MAKRVKKDTAPVDAPLLGSLPELATPPTSATHGFKQVGYPPHADVVTYDPKGRPVTSRCMGPLLLVEQAGLQATGEGQVLCSWCKGRAGVLQVHDEIYRRVVTAARAEGFVPQTSRAPVTLGSLGKDGRLALAYVIEGRREEARLHMTGLTLCRRLGLINDDHQATAEGLMLSTQDGWIHAPRLQLGGATARVA